MKKTQRNFNWIKNYEELRCQVLKTTCVESENHGLFLLLHSGLPEWLSTHIDGEQIGDNKKESYFESKIKISTEYQRELVNLIANMGIVAAEKELVC